MTRKQISKCESRIRKVVMTGATKRCFALKSVWLRVTSARAAKRDGGHSGTAARGGRWKRAAGIPASSTAAASLCIPHLEFGFHTLYGDQQHQCIDEQASTSSLKRIFNLLCCNSAPAIDSQRPTNPTLYRVAFLTSFLLSTLIHPPSIPSIHPLSSSCPAIVYIVPNTTHCIHIHQHARQRPVPVPRRPIPFSHRLRTGRPQRSQQPNISLRHMVLQRGRVNGRCTSIHTTLSRKQLTSRTFVFPSSLPSTTRTTRVSHTLCTCRFSSRSPSLSRSYQHRRRFLRGGPVPLHVKRVRSQLYHRNHLMATRYLQA